MLNGKIDSNVEVLNTLNEKYKWIPSGNNIRPLPDVKNKKIEDMNNVGAFYVSMRDYLVETIFNIQPEINTDGKCFIKDLPEKLNNLFESKLLLNKYPYDVPDNTKHYILWYPMLLRNETLSDEKITMDIKRHLMNNNILQNNDNNTIIINNNQDHQENRDILILNNHDNEDIEFVWYVNPKMTCPEVFHVQVFAHHKV